MQPNKLLAFCGILLIMVFVACNQEKTSPAITDEAALKNAVESKNTDLVKSFYPAMEKGDWATIEKIMAADYTEHNAWLPSSGITGRDTAITMLKSIKVAFPDGKYEVLHTAANGDMVFVHYRFTGSNDGPLMGMAATNKKIDHTGVDLLQVKDSVVTAHWDYSDQVTYMKQMGMMP